MRLACVLSHNICFEKGDMMPRNINWSVDLATNKKRPQNKPRELLHMANIDNRYLGIYWQ